MGCAIIVSALSCNDKTKQSTISTTENMDGMTDIFPKPKVEIKSVGIYLYNGYTALDAIGPYSVFTHLMGTDVFFIAKEKGVIEDGSGLKVQVDRTIDEVKHLDILIIPGGLAQTYLETQDEDVLNWIRSIDSSSKYTASVCTGAWILGAAGLLKDKKATTHWYGKKVLEEQFGAKVQNTRYTNSGKYWTGAGVSAGIDLSLAMLNEIAGERYTKATMLDMEYDPQPPFKGGSEHNSDKNMVETMRGLYDQGMQMALNPKIDFEHIKFDNEKDFVCGMSVSMGVADTVHYNGNIYGFCSTGCKEMFKKHPLEYVKNE